MAGVRASGLKKSFDGVEVLKGVDIEIADGEFAVLVGPSGCGKSTLLRLLAGLEKADSGELHFRMEGKSRDVTNLPPRDRDVAMVFQSYALYPHMSVRQNLEFGLRLRKTAEDEIQRRVADAARSLEIDALLDRRPAELSGGQRQRVAMGRAMVRRPSLFLFDEPLSNLDPALRNSVRVDIRKRHESLGATSVYVTHDQVEAMTLADKLFVLEGGRVQQAGSPSEIYAAPANLFVAGFLGSPAMNLVPVRGDDEGGLRTETEWRLPGEQLQRLASAGHRVGTLGPGEEGMLGLRPHELDLCGAGEPGSFSLQVDLVEHLGPEDLLHGSAFDQNFVAAVAPDSVSKGSLASFRPRRLHLFDGASGQRR